MQELAQFYATSAPRWLRINMVLSLDGSYVGTSGSSRDLSSPEDLTVLLLLRALSDVVLVGAKTALGEKYQYRSIRPELKFIRSSNPPFCIVSQSLDLPSSAPIFADQTHPPFIITAHQDSPRWQENLSRLAQHANVHVVPKASLSGKTIRTALTELGFNKIVCEGGPTLIATLLADAIVDELNLTISPNIVGSAAAAPALGELPKTLALGALAKAGSHIFTRYFRA
jgi:5-amino-6-(5-phosphoribosylamino)uracil reductase